MVCLKLVIVSWLSVVGGLGADPFLENNGGYTPWDICQQKKRKESEELAKQAILHGRFQVKVINALSFFQRLLYSPGW